jgi:uncharacterized protein YukE
MDLADVRAAIADYEKRQAKLINAWKHRGRLIERYRDEQKALTKELNEVQTRIEVLIQQERELKEAKG